MVLRQKLLRREEVAQRFQLFKDKSRSYQVIEKEVSGINNLSILDFTEVVGMDFKFYDEETVKAIDVEDIEKVDPMNEGFSLGLILPSGKLLEVTHISNLRNKEISKDYAFLKSLKQIGRAHV